MSDSNQRSTAASGLLQPTFNTLQFGSMSDSQLRQTISQLSHAASGAQYQAYAAPTPQRTTGSPSLSFPFSFPHKYAIPAYQKNIANWSTSSTPPPRTASRRSRLAKSSNLVPTPVAAPVTPSPAGTLPHIQPLAYQPTPLIPQAPAAPTDPRTARLRAPLPTTPQALQSTYASRLQTGATLLMQPILSGTSTVAVATTASSAVATSTRPRRGGVVSYADPGSGDDIPDAGEVDSDGSDFVASGGTRTAIRAARGTTLRVVNSTASYPAGGTPVAPSSTAAAAAFSRTELDQSYLGLIPPARFIIAKPFAPTKHVDLYVLPLVVVVAHSLTHCRQRGGETCGTGKAIRSARADPRRIRDGHTSDTRLFRVEFTRVTRDTRTIRTHVLCRPRFAIYAMGRYSRCADTRAVGGPRRCGEYGARGRRRWRERGRDTRMSCHSQRACCVSVSPFIATHTAHIDRRASGQPSPARPYRVGPALRTHPRGIHTTALPRPRSGRRSGALNRACGT